MFVPVVIIGKSVVDLLGLNSTETRNVRGKFMSGPNSEKSVGICLCTVNKL